ncbi:MAG TPA: hypothetical protein VF623_08265 [Segetibacter sp.]
MLFSCSKSEETVSQRKSQNYKLYDTTNGLKKEVGGFTIAELEEKNAKLTIQLDAAARITGVVMNASIVGRDTFPKEYRYAKLTDVDAATGISETAKLINDSSKNIKYADIITSKGFSVKIISGNNTAFTGAIQ